MNLILVAMGGGAGAVARYLFGRVAPSGAWPWGTFLANVSGGLLMGLLVGVLALRGGADQERWRLLLGVGFLGGYTTFSAFSLEVVLMIEKRQALMAAGYAAASAVLSVAALFAGLLIARRAFA